MTPSTTGAREGGRFPRQHGDPGGADARQRNGERDHALGQHRIDHCSGMGQLGSGVGHRQADDIGVGGVREAKIAQQRLQPQQLLLGAQDDERRVRRTGDGGAVRAEQRRPLEQLVRQREGGVGPCPLDRATVRSRVAAGAPSIGTS